jgi:putative sterol carrier protein
MNKFLFHLAFLTGAIAVIWVGFGFIDSSALAMAMTALIFIVYLVGAVELHHFRQATASLRAALQSVPDDAPDLARFLSGLAVSLQHPVRLRIEGERAVLPGPSLTPYLVGMLVMLGMLGTFLGMVVTLNGAVFTLEKTADLAAMRSALAVPVKGLGLAFGTSVAGVAASAVLGLMSALCRHDRMQAGQLLDAKATTVLSGFSHSRQREQTFRALQLQSDALPQVVDKLQAMMVQMEAMSTQLDQRLLSNQEQFHSNASETYTELARSVDKSLRESLASGAQAAGESIRPVFEAAMQGIALETKAMHERSAATVQQQLDGLASRFKVATESVAHTWSAALDSQTQANRSMVAEMARSLTAFSTTFDERAGALVATVGHAYTDLHATQAAQDAQRQQTWALSLEAVAATLTRQLQDSGAQLLAQQREICTAITQSVRETGDAYASLQAGQTAQDIQRQQAWTESLVAMAATLTSEFKDSGAQLLAQQKEICTAVTQAVRESGDAYAGMQAEQTAQESQRQQAWTQSLVAMADTLTSEFKDSGAQLLAQQREICTAITQAVRESGDAYASMQAGQTAQDTQRQQAWTQSLETMAVTLTSELKDSGAQILAQQRDICSAVTQAVGALAAQVQQDAGKSLDDTARLVTTAEELMRSRITAEAQWLDQHHERMDQLASLLKTELGALRDQEAERGDAAVAHLGELQSAVTMHLATLGAALEDPITRLIETAAEAPRAAAEVIGQLRQEMSNSVARDNVLLEERSRIMATLNTLLDGIQHASQEQRAVIDSLVASSSDKLDAARTEFTANIAGESAKLSEIAANVTSSAIDVASLADAFGVAVHSFNEANQKLASNLDRIEVALDKSMSRSDGQLAYYVAQAREIIDLSMTSQKGIVDELRQLPAMLAAESK